MNRVLRIGAIGTSAVVLVAAGAYLACPTPEPSEPPMPPGGTVTADGIKVIESHSTMASTEFDPVSGRGRAFTRTGVVIQNTTDETASNVKIKIIVTDSDGATFHEVPLYSNGPSTDRLAPGETFSSGGLLDWHYNIGDIEDPDANDITIDFVVLGEEIEWTEPTGDPSPIVFTDTIVAIPADNPDFHGLGQQIAITSTVTNRSDRPATVHYAAGIIRGPDGGIVNGVNTQIAWPAEGGSSDIVLEPGESVDISLYSDPLPAKLTPDDVTVDLHLANDPISNDP